jgi:hypothetical protein
MVMEGIIISTELKKIIIWSLTTFLSVNSRCYKFGLYLCNNPTQQSTESLCHWVSLVSRCVSEVISCNYCACIPLSDCTLVVIKVLTRGLNLFLIYCFLSLTKIQLLQFFCLPIYLNVSALIKGWTILHLNKSIKFNSPSMNN